LDCPEEESRPDDGRKMDGEFGESGLDERRDRERDLVGLFEAQIAKDLVHL